MRSKGLEERRKNASSTNDSHHVDSCFSNWKRPTPGNRGRGLEVYDIERKKENIPKTIITFIEHSL